MKHKVLILRFIKFCFIGGTGAGMQLFFTWLFTDKGHLYYLLSESIAILLALTWTFTANNNWTFKDRKLK